MNTLLIQRTSYIFYKQPADSIQIILVPLQPCRFVTQNHVDSIKTYYCLYLNPMDSYETILIPCKSYKINENKYA